MVLVPPPIPAVVSNPPTQPSVSFRTDARVGMARREVPAAALAVGAAFLLMVLIYVGSRGLKDFDSALVGYAVGTIFAVSGLVYRYTLWVTRPPTWRYFRAGWSNFLSWRNFRRYTLLIPKAWWTDIFAQTFIRARSTQRWLMHLAIFWGVVLSCRRDGSGSSIRRRRRWRYIRRPPRVSGFGTMTSCACAHRAA
jgi:hypothetical protein